MDLLTPFVFVHFSAVARTMGDSMRLCPLLCSSSGAPPSSFLLSLSLSSPLLVFSFLSLTHSSPFLLFLPPFSQFRLFASFLTPFISFFSLFNLDTHLCLLSIHVLSYPCLNFLDYPPRHINTRQLLSSPFPRHSRRYFFYSRCAINSHCQQYHSQSLSFFTTPFIPLTQSVDLSLSHS